MNKTNTENSNLSSETNKKHIKTESIKVKGSKKCGAVKKMKLGRKKEATKKKGKDFNQITNYFRKEVKELTENLVTKESFVDYEENLLLDRPNKTDTVAVVGKKTVENTKLTFQENIERKK